MNCSLSPLRRFLIATKADDRTIIWFVNESGKRGKSKFVKWMVSNLNACLLANDRNIGEDWVGVSVKCVCGRGGRGEFKSVIRVVESPGVLLGPPLLRKCDL